jgi:hypothetical protein
MPASTSSTTRTVTHHTSHISHHTSHVTHHTSHLEQNVVELLWECMCEGSADDFRVRLALSPQISCSRASGPLLRGTVVSVPVWRREVLSRLLGCLAHYAYCSLLCSPVTWASKPNPLSHETLYVSPLSQQLIIDIRLILRRKSTSCWTRLLGSTAGLVRFTLVCITASFSASLLQTSTLLLTCKCWARGLPWTHDDHQHAVVASACLHIKCCRPDNVPMSVAARCPTARTAPALQ